MNKNQIKKLILIDLDGVLNTYTGNYKPDFIEPIKDGAKDFLKNLSNKYRLKIFTTRNHLLVSKWLIKNKIDIFIEDVTSIKEPCLFYIDDRCINFDGDYTKILKTIDKFEPWHKTT